MKGLLFFLVVLAITIIIWRSAKGGGEGFQDQAPEGSSPGLNIPLVSPRAQTLVAGEAKPFDPPTADLLAPPPGQIAEVNTRPAINPAMEKAMPARIQSIYESLQGFFEREEPSLSKLGDPSIQLPLTTARADRARLGDEMAVLKRNPGLASSLTEEDLNGIEANLGYLQKKWRMSVNSGVLSPMPGGEVEGFQGGLKGWLGRLFGGAEEGFQGTDSTSTPTPAATSTPSSTSTAKGTPVTLQELKELSLKLNVEILHLQESGTTNLNIGARVDRLAAILALVTQEISAVEGGKKTLAEVPLTKEQIATFLPVMRNLNTALPALLEESGLSSILNSLFPPYAAGDVEGAKVSREMFDRYGKTLLNNLSWDVNLKYKSEAEREIAKNLEEASMYQKQTAEQNAEAAKVYAATDPVSQKTKDAYRGMFQSIVGDLAGKGVSTSVTMSSPTASTQHGAAGTDTTAAATTDGHSFNWKERATHICDQISKRGMNPSDFACLKNAEGDKYVGFSWRGHAKMVCNRLSTVYDPSIPELCGCPPPTWAGWRA